AWAETASPNAATTPSRFIIESFSLPLDHRYPSIRLSGSGQKALVSGASIIPDFGPRALNPRRCRTRGAGNHLPLASQPPRTVRARSYPVPSDPDLSGDSNRAVGHVRVPADGRGAADRRTQPERRETERVRVRLPGVRGLAQPVRCSLLPDRDPVHRVRSRSGIPVPVGGKPGPYGL